MSLLPQISGQEVIKAFEKLGYRVVRQRGSHVRLRPPEHSTAKHVTVPNHRVVAKGLLRKLIRDSGVTVDAFLALLR